MKKLEARESPTIPVREQVREQGRGCTDGGSVRACQKEKKGRMKESINDEPRSPSTRR